ncbi:MAG: NADPH:quinone reductase [Bacteroidetes bacterium]|nr:NADPH:quinone reductase [Bacteroidota bacterium]
MKAIRVLQPGPSSVMQLTEVPDLKPEPGQVLIRVKAAGVNPVDTYLRAGEQGYKPICPYTPGIDLAGEVVEISDGVIHVKPGDRVYSAGCLTGSYAEYALAKASQVFHLPDNLSFSQGATIHVPYATAYRALMLKANARPGETVLVHGGTGGVGIAAIQICRWKGMTAIATAGSAHGANILKSIGTSAVVDHHDPEHFQTIISLTEGRGVDIILEMMASLNLGKDLQLLRTAGRVVVVGSRGPVEINPRDIMSRDAMITGLALRNATDSELFAIHLDLIDGFKRGFLNPIISHEFPLSEAPHAHDLIMNTRAEGKIVLIPE